MTTQSRLSFVSQHTWCHSRENVWPFRAWGPQSNILDSSRSDYSRVFDETKVIIDNFIRVQKLLRDAPPANVILELPLWLKETQTPHIQIKEAIAGDSSMKGFFIDEISRNVVRFNRVEQHNRNHRLIYASGRSSLSWKLIKNLSETTNCCLRFVCDSCPFRERSTWGNSCMPIPGPELELPAFFNIIHTHWRYMEIGSIWSNRMESVYRVPTKLQIFESVPCGIWMDQNRCQYCA